MITHKYVSFFTSQIGNIVLFIRWSHAETQCAKWCWVINALNAFKFCFQYYLPWLNISLACKQSTGYNFSFTKFQISHAHTLLVLVYIHLTDLTQSFLLWCQPYNLLRKTCTGFSYVLFCPWIAVIYSNISWMINHCLGLGHEMMTHAVCITMFSWRLLDFSATGSVLHRHNDN